MAHRGRPAAPRAILAQGVGVNPPLILHQLEVSLKTIHLTITANDETCLKWLAEKGLVSNTELSSLPNPNGPHQQARVKRWKNVEMSRVFNGNHHTEWKLLRGKPSLVDDSCRVVILVDDGSDAESGNARTRHSGTEDCGLVQLHSRSVLALGRG